MKSCLFGLIVACGLLLLIDADDLRYKQISSTRSWHDANKDCRSRDGTLLDLETHVKVTSFQKSITLEPKQMVWTSAYRKYSPWIWVEGCFSASFLTKSDGIRIPKNQASECAAICSDTSYAALKGSACFCLEDMRELLPMDARVCDVPCPGSPGEICGGKGSVSLYSLGGVNGYKESAGKTKAPEQTVHEISRADWKNCVYILKHKTPIWVTADCGKTLPFLCKIYREGGVIEYRSPKNKFGSWTASRDMCRDEGGTLADLHSNSMEAVSALPDQSEYWVGLYRNTSWAWHADTNTDETEEIPAWCTSVSEDQVGNLQFQTESCSIPHPYVCQIETPTASASSSNLVTYVVCGTIAWVLAIVTAMLIFYKMRRRGCRRATSDDGTTQIHSNYFDLDDESVASRPSRQHSYVNSQAGNQPTCSRPPPCQDPPLKPGSLKNQDTSRIHTTNGNEYATVTMSKGKPDPAEQYDDLSSVSDGACGSARSSTSAEGDYDHVWDSLKLARKQLNDLVQSKNSDREHRRSDSSEHIYTEVAKVTHVNLPERIENDYVTTPSKLFPPIDEFGRERSFGKHSLGRTRSKSL